MRCFGVGSTSGTVMVRPASRVGEETPASSMPQAMMLSAHEVGIAVERKTVHGHPATHADPDGPELCDHRPARRAHLHAAAPVDPLDGHAEVSARADHHDLLEPAHMGDHIDRHGPEGRRWGSRPAGPDHAR